MSSFSARRQGRPRPCNMTLGRRRSEDKSMPSPSFNSSMALGNVEDVFCDSSRSVDRLRQHYLAMPTTPSTHYGGSSPGARMERLPSLTDLFHRDILSPPSSSILPQNSKRSEQDGTNMQRTGSTSSASSDRSRIWIPSFYQDGRTSCIGPPATPLSPFFNAGAPLISPTTVTPDRRYVTGQGYSDGEQTPRALQRSSFDFTEHVHSNKSSPRCPGAPLIGVQNRGHFESQTWHSQPGARSLGSFEGIQRRETYGRRRVSQLSADELIRERAVMSRIEADMPKAAGLNGLGIHMDQSTVHSPSHKEAGRGSNRNAGEISSSPKGQTILSGHTGLTPMVKASKMADSSTTPTRSKARSSPRSAQALSSCKARSSQAKISPSATAAKKKAEAAKTPLNKSRPMFRLDTGSGKRSSKPTGHKMCPDASPWGVFGVKDGWKPLAPPNVSRAIAEANKLVLETTSAASSTKMSPTGKREAWSEETSSPSKRSRVSDSQNASSPYKENIAPSYQSMSPSKRAHMKLATHRDSPTALPLSTVR